MVRASSNCLLIPSYVGIIGVMYNQELERLEFLKHILVSMASLRRRQILELINITLIIEFSQCLKYI